MSHQSGLVERAGGLVNLTILVPGGLREISQGHAVNRYGSGSGRVFCLSPLLTEPGSS